MDRRKLLYILPLLWIDTSGAEVLVEPAHDTATSTTARMAGSQATRARRQQQGKAATPAVVLQVEEEEGGILSPSPSLPERRARAFGYQQDMQPQVPGNVPDNTVIIQERDLSGPTSARESVNENRARASAYMRGENVPSNIVPGSPVSAKEMPVIRCENPNRQGNATSSSVGQVGDALQPGSVLTIFQNGRQIKVRCQPSSQTPGTSGASITN